MCKPRGAGHYLPANIERAIMSTNYEYAVLEAEMLSENEDFPTWGVAENEESYEPSEYEFCGELVF